MLAHDHTCAMHRPYKMELDNTLRLLTEQHTSVLIFVATTMNSMEQGSTISTDWDKKTLQMWSDTIAMVSLVAMVLLPLLVVVLCKLVIVKATLVSHLEANGTHIPNIIKFTRLLDRLPRIITWIAEKQMRKGQTVGKETETEREKKDGDHDGIKHDSPCSDSQDDPLASEFNLAI